MEGRATLSVSNGCKGRTWNPSEPPAGPGRAKPTPCRFTHTHRHTEVEKSLKEGQEFRFLLTTACVRVNGMNAMPFNKNDLFRFRQCFF